MLNGTARMRLTLFSGPDGPARLAIATLTGADRPGKVVVIGAGSGDGLERWLDSPARQVVAVEPHPEHVRALAARARPASRLESVAAALSNRAGEAEFRLFNMADASALRAPTGIAALYPGLEPLGTAEVTVVTLPDLLRDNGIDRDEANVLVVDAPLGPDDLSCGADGGVLADWFDAVLIRAGEEALHEGTRSADGWRSDLSEAGFDPVAEDASDPDIPWLGFVANPRAGEIDALRREVAQARAEAEGERVAAHERIAVAERTAQEAAAENDRLTARVSELEAELTGARAQAEAQETALRAELSEARTRASEAFTARDALATERDAAHERISDAERKAQEQTGEVTRLRARGVELESELARLRAEAEARESAHQDQVQAAQAATAEAERARAAADAEVQRLGARVTEVEQALSTAQQATKAEEDGRADLDRRLHEAETACADLAERAERQDKRVDEAERAAETARRDLSLALRMRAVAETDVADLRERHAQVQEAKHQQDVLIAQLVRRLDEASAWLQDLAGQDGAQDRVQGGGHDAALSTAGAARSSGGKASSRRKGKPSGSARMAE